MINTELILTLLLFYYIIGYFAGIFVLLNQYKGLSFIFAFFIAPIAIFKALE